MLHIVSQTQDKIFPSEDKLPKSLKVSLEKVGIHVSWFVLLIVKCPVQRKISEQMGRKRKQYQNNKGPKINGYCFIQRDQA